MANESILNALGRMWEHISVALGGKSDTSHTHDDIYYTEPEIDEKLLEVNASISNIVDGTTSVQYAINAEYAMGSDNAVVATKASNDYKGNNIIDTYETKTDASAKLDEAKAYADDIKDDLLNGAGDAYDTLKELGDLIDENVNAIEALEIVATGKADGIHASQHASGGDDPITPEMIEAWAERASVSNDCNIDIQAANGKVFVRKYGTTNNSTSTLNTPYTEGITTYSQGVVITYAYSSSYGTQVAFAGGKVFVRKFVGETIDKWSELATTDYALPRDGSADMTGDLSIVKNSTTRLELQDTKNGDGRRVRLQNRVKNAQLVNYLDDNNFASIQVLPESSDFNSLRFRQLLNGKEDVYYVIHTGNSNLIKPSDIGALKIYTNITDLGLTEASATAEQIALAMNDNSMLLHAASGTATSSALGLPVNWGLLRVIKRTSSYVEFDYNSGTQSWSAYYNHGSSSGTKWYGWKKIATTDYVDSAIGNAIGGSY